MSTPTNRRTTDIATATRALTGRLILRDEPGFEEAAVGRVFNARRPQRRPAAVLFAETYDDLVAGVRLARERGWQVVSRSGGHSWAAWGLREEALLIDVHQLNRISYDAASGIATVDSGVRGGEQLAPFLAERGRLFPGGHCPSVGVAGFLLQGGQGWCARGFGWAAEYLVAIDVVTPDGGMVRADTDHHSDLYWAARGAGPGFFGVIARFHLRTRPAPKAMSHSVLVFDIDDYRDVMGWLYATHAQVDPEVEIVAVSQRPPAELELPVPHDRHVLIVSALAFKDTVEDAGEALAPIDSCPVGNRALFAVECAPTTLTEQYASQYANNPDGHRYTVDNAWLDADAATSVELLDEAFTTWATPESFSLWFSMAPLRALPDMAFSMQSEVYCALYTVSNDADTDTTTREWTDTQMRRLEPITAGQYLGDSDLTNRQVKFMSDENFARLQQIRSAYDPDGLFVDYLTLDAATINRNHWQQEGSLR